MKIVQNIVLTLVTVLTFTLCSCNPASVPDVTPDEIPVVATAEVAQTEPTTAIEETTVPETTAPEVTEPTKVQEPEKTENKPVNNNSSDKQQNNSNNSGNQTANKPSNNTSSGSNSSSSSTNKKPAEPKPVVITDDTPLTYDEFVNDKNIQRLCDDVIDFFVAKGMRYDTSVSINNSGWFYGYCSANNVTAVRSYNQQKSRTITCLDEQVEACLLSEQWYSDGTTEYYYTVPVDKWRFNCYYGIDANGYYNIYFAYR
ncbi:MAG: hypothetical protein IJD93_02780 [Ruminococcus sp.]|nr:hypothetical protein [Ruminococcus sp.]